MDPNLFRVLASGVYPSPLPSPQESLNMVFPLQVNPQVLQQEFLRQLLYQQAFSNFLVPSLPLKAISPVVSTPQLLPTAEAVSSIAEEKRPSPVPALASQHQTLVAALSSPTIPPSLPTPITSESPKPIAGGDHCNSPSTSSQNNKEEEEEDLFVDVESVDSKVANKDRRKAHVEFFRKIKSIRQRAILDTNGDRFLQCAICNEKVPMQDNAIQLHVNTHADAGGYRCQLCGFEKKEKAKLYNHMRAKHPNKALELIEDRRNIYKLSAYIEVVFPRACVKTKKDSTKEVELLIKHLEEKKMTEISCSVCERLVVATKAALTRHAGSHPWYRCKSCKFTTESEKEQENHQITEHLVASPRLTGEYNLCTAMEVVSRQVSRCFSHAMQ